MSSKSFHDLNKKIIEYELNSSEDDMQDVKVSKNTHPEDDVNMNVYIHESVLRQYLSAKTITTFFAACQIGTFVVLFCTFVFFFMKGIFVSGRVYESLTVFETIVVEEGPVVVARDLNILHYLNLDTTIDLDCTTIMLASLYFSLMISAAIYCYWSFQSSLYLYRAIKRDCYYSLSQWISTWVPLTASQGLLYVLGVTYVERDRIPYAWAIELQISYQFLILVLVYIFRDALMTLLDVICVTGVLPGRANRHSPKNLNVVTVV